MNVPSQSQVENTLITRFGLENTLGFYLKNANDAAGSLEVAVADKNALAMAKHARDLVANTKIAYSILVKSMNGEVKK